MTFHGEKLITVRVNGQPQTLVVPPRVALLEALRDRLGLTGTKLHPLQATARITATR